MLTVRVRSLALVSVCVQATTVCIQTLMVWLLALYWLCLYQLQLMYCIVYCRAMLVTVHAQEVLQHIV